MSNKETMAIIATSPLAIKFFLEFIISEFEKKYSIIIMTNTSDNHDILRTLTSRIKIIDIKIKREINLISDIRTAFILMKHLSTENISVVYSITPKAGFIGILVSKIMKVPVRIHNFTGQVWKTKKGLIKHVLKSIDRLIYLLSTRVIVDSHSQREFLINNNIIKRQKSIVIGDGSISGVDIDLFSPNQHVKQEIREQLKTKSDAIVFLYIGRLSLEKGIIELIKSTGIEISGKNAVVIGRSNIVGKPISLLLMKNNATITICHSKTLDLKKHCLNADIIVAAIGKPNFVTEDMVKKGCVVIDVGINRLDDGSLSGDVDYINVKNNSSYITPVPGGVGPMTIAMLMQNTLECYKEIEKLE